MSHDAGSQGPATESHHMGPKTRTKVMGGLLVAVGLLALLFPVFSTLAYELYLGWVFILAGLTMLVRAWDYGGGWRLVTGSAFALLAIAVGIGMLLFPHIGVPALTLLVALLMIGDGVASLGFAMFLRTFRASLLVLLTGSLELLLGLLLLFNVFAVAPYMLGLILGVSLFLSGISLLVWNYEGTRRAQLAALAGD